MEEEERVQKGHTIYVDLYVTLADLYVGKEVKVKEDIRGYSLIMLRRLTWCLTYRC